MKTTTDEIAEDDVIVVLVDGDSEFVFHGSVVTAIGLTGDGTKRVKFGGDARPMYDLAERCEQGDETTVALEGWQVLSIEDVA